MSRSFFFSHTSDRGHSGVTQCVYQFTTTTSDISCLFIFPRFLPQRGVLYQGLHSGSSMVAMGKAGLLGHGLGGYGLPSPSASGASAWLFCFCAIRIQIEGIDFCRVWSRQASSTFNKGENHP